MITSSTVGKDKLLLCDVHPIDEVHVDNETSPQSTKVGPVIAELVSNHVFKLAELKGNNPFLVILRHHLRIIAISRYINQPLGGNTEEFRPFRYYNYLIQFEALYKVNEFFLRVKPRFERMYEIAKYGTN